MTFLRVFSLTIFLSSHVNCLNSTTRIIGGDVANAGTYNYIAGIYVTTEDGRYFCGGALITNQHIITSGICVNNAILFTVYLGSNQLSGDDPNRQIFSTSTYHVHPDYNPETLENDVGIIQLRMSISLTTYIQPIFLAPNHINDNTATVSLGFGQTSDDESELSNELRFVNVVTLSNEECRIFYGNQVNENMMCVSGNDNEGICIGDNGSPLVMRNGKYSYVVGVASFMSANGCESTEPSGYTRVFPYLTWIRETISNK